MKADFLKYQAQTSPFPLSLEINFAKGSYIFDTQNKKDSDKHRFRDVGIAKDIYK